MTISVSFKTLTQASFTLDLEETDTVADMKAKIFSTRGEDYETSLQKLIYNGKILEDGTKVSEVGFEPNKFVVVMLGRKPAVKKEEPLVAPVASSDSASAQTPSATSAASAVQTAPQVVQNIPSHPPPSVDSGFSVEQEGMIEAVSSMGYPRSQVIAALRAAYWNPDRAVEFLITGLPADVEGEHGGAAEEDEEENLSANAPENFAMLENLPQLNDLRALVQQNPEMLATILQQMAVMNPRLVQAIQGNQQAFIDLLNAPIQRRSGGQAAAGAGGAGGAPPGAQRVVIELTPEELEAVNRIKSMGFQVPERVIVEAYLACDKNEEAAVDFILSNMGDDMEE
ncbi:unnamed protein product [Caenorhabditis auriculariae]|uniref:UV excision repair protein RAD23 n=1 Tax=Caenorhabditis auriculariae TaxID=2777116 RepID=A0A8S1HBK7_9PELO|nr:unnamed protein product [Caenorhabditis auriculariae]